MAAERAPLVRGLATGVSIAVVNGAGAAGGIVLAQKFGKSARTDGFLAAYAVYLVLVLAAQSFRSVALPDLTRAAGEGRLAREVTRYGLALSVLAIPVALVAILAARPLADALTGSLPRSAVDAASAALPWLVVAAVGQLYASLAASALAARDSYGVAAASYGIGAVAGLAIFVALADAHGTVALAWGVAVNAAISMAIPVAVLAARGELAPPGGGDLDLRRRVKVFGQGAVLPLALQGLYVVAVRFAADLGVGKVTTLGYGYFIAAFLVAVTATSISLISSAPLTRRNIGPRQAAEHVIHSSWLSLAVVAGAAGVFALAGPRIASGLLGSAFGGSTGRQLSELVVFLGPWMVVSIALGLTFPLLFILERARVLFPLSILIVVVQVPLAWGLSKAAGLDGLALSLAVTSLLALGVLMAALSPEVLRFLAAGLSRLALVEGGLAAVCFGALALVGRGIPEALVGLALYAGLLGVWRPTGLRSAWAYGRALH